MSDVSEIAIRAEGVGKQYVIGETQGRHNTLRDALAGSVTRAWHRLRRLGRPTRRDRFWALRDVSFELARGEVLGIIGHNGAGKSTLLKILSRITEPTTGEVMIRGRVGSLLEVGTGFHSELTGRENIYLNGAILGMTRAEIDRKFDEIVAFAEVERFIDTPVKHYSSGMYLRLGFSVAAHLEPEILIVDEVLAVGDAEFQQKCLGRMGEVAREGRTVIFVSHNVDAIRRLCSRVILLERGELVMDGSVHTVTSHYMASTLLGGRPNEWTEVSAIPRTGSGEARINAIRFGSSGADPTTLHPDAPFHVLLRIAAKDSITIRCMSLMISDDGGNKLINAEIATKNCAVDLHPGDNVVRFSIDRLHLNPGVYSIGCWMGRGIEDDTPIDFIESAVSFEVVAAPQGMTSFPWAIAPVTCDFSVEADLEVPAASSGDGADLRYG